MADFLHIIEESYKTIIENPLLLIALIIGIIILIRDIRCWYWKINDRIKLQNREIEILEDILILQRKEYVLLEKKLSKIDQIIENTTPKTDIPPVKTEVKDTVDS